MEKSLCLESSLDSGFVINGIELVSLDNSVKKRKSL